MASSGDSLLRKVFIDRIKLFTGKDFFLDTIYENNTQEIFPDHKNLWNVSQLPEFSHRRPVPWNRATLEQITVLYELHEDLKELY